MQQLSRKCMKADHKSKVIEYVCLYDQCQLSRFLCSMCLLGNVHKHDRSNNLHIVDNSDFYEEIKNKMSKAKGKQSKGKHNIQNLIDPLKQLIYEIENLFKNVSNFTKKVEQVRIKNINLNHLENQLLNIQKYGFNQIDDESLNDLINIPQEQQDLDIYNYIEDQANLIIEHALKIKEWSSQKDVFDQKLLSQKIKDVKYQIQQIDDTGDKLILAGAVSNDLKYIASGGDDYVLKFWDYQQNKLIKQIELNNFVRSCKFTEDSQVLFVGSHKYLYQFDVNNQFNELNKYDIHNNYINNIYCISNNIILSASDDKTITIIDVNKKQQLLKIQAHNRSIYGLDYHKSLNIIVSGSDDRSIKLWNGNDGSLIIEKVNAHNHLIRQVLFIFNNNQLISLDNVQNLIIWNIKIQIKQLEQVYLIENSGRNISLVLQQQYIISTGEKLIKVYSNKGEFIRQFDHIKFINLDNYNTVQLDSMKVVLILGLSKLQVCKLDMD